MLPIDKGLTIPPAGIGRPRGNLAATLNALEVGDSVQTGAADKYAVASVRSSVQYSQRMGAKRFATRLVEGGLRVWRTL